MPPKTAFPRLRWAALVWLAVWTPAYAVVWGWRNFLLLCDLSVFLACAGIWRASPLLLSSQAVASLIIGLAWAAGFALLALAVFRIRTRTRRHSTTEPQTAATTAAPAS